MCVSELLLRSVLQDLLLLMQTKLSTQWVSSLFTNETTFEEDSGGFCAHKAATTIKSQSQQQFQSDESTQD